MDAEGEMDAGDDQAPPGNVVDDISLKEMVDDDPSFKEVSSDDNGKWEVNEEDTVSMGGADSVVNEHGTVSTGGAVGAELNVQESVSISTGDYPHIDDHEMDVVLMGRSIDNCVSGQSFGSEGENIAKEEAKEDSELGALHRYVIECSSGRDKFEDDNVKNEAVDGFEDDNEFGFQQRSQREEIEFENISGEEEAYEVSQARGAIGYSSGLHLEQLLADSEGEENSNFLQYNREEGIEEAGGSSRVPLEAEVGLFYQPMKLDQGVHCSEVVQTVDASYSVEGDARSQLKSDITARLCSTGDANGLKFEEPVGTRDDVLVLDAGNAQDELLHRDSNNRSDDIISFRTEEVALVLDSEEIIDHSTSSQKIVGGGVDTAELNYHVIFHREEETEGQPVETVVALTSSLSEEPGERVQARRAFPVVERDLAGSRSHFTAEVEVMEFVERPTGQGAYPVGQNVGNESPQVPLLNAGSASSFHFDQETNKNETIEHISQCPLHQVVQSQCDLKTADHHAHSVQKPDTEGQGTSSEVAIDRDTLLQDYEAMRNHSTSGSLEVAETASVKQRGTVMSLGPSVPLLFVKAKVEQEVVDAESESLNNPLLLDENTGDANVGHEADFSEQQVHRLAKPSAQNCDVAAGVEEGGILSGIVQSSDHSTQILDCAHCSDTNYEEYNLGGLNEVASKSNRNNGALEGVRNVHLDPQLREGTLDREPAHVDFEAPRSSRVELVAETCECVIDSNVSETLTSVVMEAPGNQQFAALRDYSKCGHSFANEDDARKGFYIGSDVYEVRNEIQSVAKSPKEVPPVLLSGVEKQIFYSVENFEALENRGQSRAPTEAAVETFTAFKSADQSATRVFVNKIQMNENVVPLIPGSRDVNDSHQKLQSREVVLETQRNNVTVESAESPAIRKGREDVKSKYPQQETIGVPLWVKWRGKWQPGIQCSTIDCPPATLKAKPSYSKKHYIVVYSPTARNFSWVDIQHTCPITEDPMPLFSGTHESGRDTVKDVFITRRRMLLKLGGEMLDISDRLHVKAVVESARNVNVWKSFASEAAAATTYAELGTLLVSLHLAIVRDFIKPTWMAKRYPHWKEECVRAESASAVHKLTKELINAVLWDDVGPLWNEPDQPELDPQWSNWKGEAFEEKEEPGNEGDARFAGPFEMDGAPGKNAAIGGSKRFKEQARSRRQRPQSAETSENTPFKRSKHNPRDSEGAIVGRAITAFRSPLVHPTGMLQNQPCVPVLEADRCHEVISGHTLASLNGQVVKTNADNETLTQLVGSRDTPLQLASSSANYQSDDSEGDESKVFERIGKSGAASMAEGLIALESGLCSAYLKNKVRRCNRFAKKEGIKYCEKHIYLIDPESAGKKIASEENMAWQSGLCSAFLRRENRRCARQAKEGFNGYCGFHVHLSTNDNDRNGDVTDVVKGEGVIGNSSSLSVKDDRCQGITTRGVQCTHRTKDGSLFCVKHSLKGASQAEKDESKGQPSGDSKMDWEKGTDPGVSLVAPGQAGRIDSHHDVDSQQGTREGMVRVLELKCLEHSRGSEGTTRKRKALSSFFTDRTVGDPRTSRPPSQEAFSPKFTDGKPNQWTQCKGRTTRNEEQCSFRAKEGHEYCSKHLNAMDAKKKINFQRSLRKDEGKDSETKGLRARNLLHRFIKGAGGVCSQSSGSDVVKQLVQSTILEAARDGTAEELVKLVSVETTKLQLFLHPLDAGEGKKADVNSGFGFIGSSSHSPPKASEGPEPKRGARIPPGFLGDEHRILNDKPVTCGLCDVEFLGAPDLGKHWQLVHKKEVSLFVKGHACRVCDRLYTRKQTVMTHWKKRHQSIVMTNPDLSVCFACDVRYADDDFLLEHVIAMHPYQLSSPSLKEMIAQNRAIIGAEHEGTETLRCRDCSEEFDSHLGLYQHCEKVHRRSGNEGNGVTLSNPGDGKPGESTEVASQNGKYVCRLCGMTFPMLPDLGRHHQAVHMLCSKAAPVRGSAPSTKEAAFESGRMKLPIRRKTEDKAGASDPGYGPTKRKRRKLRFTSQKKSFDRDTRGSDSLRFHVQAVLQGATLRKRHKKQLDDLSSEPAGKDPSPLIPSDINQLRENTSNPNRLTLNDGILSLACTGSTSLSLTRRVESNFESVQEKFKRQADKIFTNFSQLHGESSVKRESQVDAHSATIDSGKTWSASRGSMKQEHDLEASKDMNSERLKSAPNYSDAQEQRTAADVKRPDFIVTCEDLSGGQEQVPIVCVIDEDVLLQLRSLSNKESGGKDVYQPSSFTYITKRRLDPSLGLDPENYKIGCTCGKAQCTPDACEHVNLFDCDNAEACDMYGKPMRGRFPYDDQGCIILEEGYLVYECNSSCQCQLTCHNRVLQKGVTVKLEVFKTQYKGWAVRAAEKISRGTFVCEYVGEVLHDHEANKRGERYDQVGCSYLYDIDAHLDIGAGRRCKPFVIDATSQGNVARFINHSCAPNLVNYQVLVESMDAQLAHIGLFASRNIEIGEELSYDYRYRLLPGKGCPCHCGAKNCRGRLY